MFRIGRTAQRWRAPASGLVAVLLLLSMALGGAVTGNDGADGAGAFAGPPPTFGAL